MNKADTEAPDVLPVFDRNFWDRTFRFTRIGSGALGGKASRLVFMKDLLPALDASVFPGFEISVPTMAVLSTDLFDEFIAQNHLSDLHFEELSDDLIAHAFQKASLPAELVGDLRALITAVKSPLAIRSSSLLEDELQRPFAGVYATKMIPNNELDPAARFHRLTEAIKLVYASTYFKEARAYIRTTGSDPTQEKMAVIIQEVVGRRHGDRFYPDISGVARSYNFYPSGDARPEEGVVSLALGLGKTIVDGDVCWTFSPAHPKNPPPFGSIKELMNGTQTRFWAVNMGKAPEYDPVNEVECMVHANIVDAENDEVLRLVASTYDPGSDRIIPGIGQHGPRVLNFAPLLTYEEFPVTAVLRLLLETAEKAIGEKVEIEFAISFEEQRGQSISARLGFLQVRPMLVSGKVVNVTAENLRDADAIIASDMVMGNGEVDSIRDIVFVRPENFSVRLTPKIAEQLDAVNRKLLIEKSPYLLIGFGRLGSSHASLGIPVNWSQISGARVIVEATQPQMNVELSQGSHFFHNLSSFGASYFMVHHDSLFRIDWHWLNQQTIVEETELIRHVRLPEPLLVRVDGRTARGVILRGRNRDGEKRQ